MCQCRAGWSLEAALVLAVQLYGAAALLSAVTTTTTLTSLSTPSMTPSETAPPSASPAVTPLTINECDRRPDGPPNDCHCPPGYESMRQRTSPDRWHRETPLCVGLRSPGPWAESCVPSGTGTDYYDLHPDERGMVRDFLHARAVLECWISARRIAPGGALVRRLPGNRWNERIVAHEGKKAPVTLAPDAHEATGSGCAALGGPTFGQLAIRNCSRALPQLCLYREEALLRLHCRAGEYTTRYAALQRSCFTVRTDSPDTWTWLGSSPEYRPMDATGTRRRTLRAELLQKFSSAIRNRCYSIEPVAHRAVKRAQNALMGANPAGAVTVAQPDDQFDCVVLERVALGLAGTEDGAPPEDDGSDDEADSGASASMHLYFDKGRHKLFLTVYGRWRFWRERPTDAGFGCYTNADVELIRRVKTSPVRQFQLHRHQTHRGDDRDDDDDDDDDGNSDATDRTMYEVHLVSGGSPGQYWCEAHLVPDFTQLVSAPVLAHRRPDGKSFFSATVELRLNRTDVVSMRLSSYDRYIADHIKHRGGDGHDGRRPALQPVFDAIKSLQVKRVEATWPASTERGPRYTIHLIVHVVMKRIKSWRDFPAIDELAVNEIELPEKYVYYNKMRWYVRSALESLNSADFRLLGVNSTEYCLPDSLRLAPDGNVWWTARLGETVAPKNLCLLEHSGLPLTRRCLGDFLYGCAWEGAVRQQHEQCSRLKHPATRALYEYSTGCLNQSVLAHVFQTVGDVLAEPAHVLAADLFYISKTLENVRTVLVPDVPAAGVVTVTATDAPDSGNRTGEQYYCNITGIMNRLMYVNRTIVVRSQVALNTTNILLDAIETMVNGMALANDSAVLLRGSQVDCGRRVPGGDGEEDAGGLTLAGNDGTVLFRSPRLIVLIADPTVANVSGLALFRDRTPVADEDYIAQEATDEEGDFGNYTLRYLYANQSQESLFADGNLEIGSFIPQSVLDNLGPLQAAMAKTEEEVDLDEAVPASAELPAVASGPPAHLRVIVTIYYNDRAFQETRNGTIARPNSKIISVTIPGYGSRMPDEIPIYTRQHNPDRASRCGYWSFDGDDRPGEFGRWSYDECRLVNVSASGELTLCGCFHLTSFSRLTMDTQMVETVGVSKKLIADQSTLALDIITVIGCSLSLLGVVGILVTAALFPSWRVKASSKILLQLSCAIAVEMIIIFFEGPDIENHRASTGDRIECTLLGSVFHYIILVTFMWMLVSAYLQFMRYVKVLGRLRPSHFILKATMCCWGLPSLPVIAFLIIDHRLYMKQDNFSDICYPHGNALYYGLLLPIGTIIFLNFISFVFVLYNIFTIPSNLTKTPDHDMTLAQLRLSVFLFFLLGLPWIFGMLTTGSVDKLFAYLFCLTAPLQGFVLFVYFIIMDPIARRLWLRKLQRCPCIGRLDKQLDEKEATSPSTSFNTHL